MKPVRENRWSRRALLATVASSAGASVAGCLGGSATAPSSDEATEDAAEEVMAHNPKPFADRPDAIAYVESYDGLGKDDIISLDGFGAEQANRYRDYPLPDDR